MEMLSPADAAKALSWLEGRGLDGLTGFDAGGWPGSVWVLHAMYETGQLVGGITHDEVAHIERASGIPTVPPSGDASLDAAVGELLDRATLTGGGLGASEHPGPAWDRLLWSELASRLETDPFALELPPCHRSFPYKSWPVNIEPPAEGSLDKEQFLALVDVLGGQSKHAMDTICFAYRCPVSIGVFDGRTVYRCHLHELPDLYDDGESGNGAPNNIWPDDNSWFTYTDADLWATKVSGNAQLTQSLHADPRIEAVELPF